MTSFFCTPYGALSYIAVQLINELVNLTQSQKLKGIWQLKPIKLS